MSTTIRGFDHVQLAIPVGGEPDARAFYVGLLGLTEVPKPPDMALRGGAWFAFDGGQLHVGVETPFVPSRKAHPAFRLASGQAVRDLERHLTEHGHPTRLAEGAAGVVRFHVDAPFGNRLEFTAPEG